MIVNRSHAEEASEVLNLPLPELSTGTLKAAWLTYAKQHHPDRGGDPHRFAAGDRAKCILELWIAKAPEAPTLGLSATPCVRCHGEGRMRVQRGFRFFAIRCETCHGTGDGGYDADRTGVGE